jgi:hypothetical protein
MHGINHVLFYLRIPSNVFKRLEHSAVWYRQQDVAHPTFHNGSFRVRYTYAVASKYTSWQNTETFGCRKPSPALRALQRYVPSNNVVA